MTKITGRSPVTEPTVAASVAEALLDFAVSRGADPRQLVVKAGIDPLQLHDPAKRVPFARYIALMSAAKSLTGDPALALRFGQEIEMADMSLVGLLGRSAGTTGEALGMVNRFGRLIVEVETEGRDRFCVRREGHQLWLLDNRKNPNDFPELTESTFARMVSAVRRMLPGCEVFNEVHVSHARPAYGDEYQSVFEVPVVFESDRNGLALDENWSDQKVALQPRYALDILGDHAQTLLEDLECSKTTRGRAESVLLRDLSRNGSTMTNVARELGLSRQTLHRRLKAEGATFETVSDQLRHKLAVSYLEGELSMTEISYRLGFSETTAFSRAFKRWTGSSPRNLRN